MHMQVLALGDGLHHSSDVDAVLDDRVALAIVLQRELVADGNVVPRHDLEVLVVFHDPAGEMLAGLDAFHDDDADAVALLVHHQMNHALPCERSERSIYSIRMLERGPFLKCLPQAAVSPMTPPRAQLNARPRFI